MTTEATKEHAAVVDPKPVYDLSVGAGYLVLCRCTTAVTLTRMMTTYNGVNVDYARSLDDGLHPTGVELLNLKNFSALEADLVRIGMDKSEAKKVAKSFIENPPLRK